jgi:hypothetical protein
VLDIALVSRSAGTVNRDVLDARNRWQVLVASEAEKESSASLDDSEHCGRSDIEEGAGAEGL